MAKIKGVILDFNGTLFWDTQYNNKAWDSFLNLHGFNLSDQEKLEIIHGRNNQDSIKELFGGRLNPDELYRLSRQKEEFYRKFCLEGTPELAPGATDFLRFLMKNNTPFTLATASINENIDFYFENLGLGLYFDRNKVVYNDGVIKSKPHPEYYEKAMKILGIRKEETLVFEDSFAGISSAENAGVAQIIIVNSNNDDYSNWDYQVIKDFNEVDTNIF